MKKIVIILMSFIILSLTDSFGQNVQALLDSANNYYSKGKYEKAISNYKQILAQGKESAGIYYNLGNAYYKTHQIAPAILNYERARLRAPGNEDIQYNLELARSQVTDKIDALPEFFLTKWFRQFVNTMSSNGWAIMSMLTFVLFLIFLSLYIYTRRYGLKKTSFWVSLIALLIAASSFVFSYQQKKDIENSQQAIVFSSKVTVRSSPAESGTELFVIHEGTKVYIEERMDEWYEIKLADGSKGWLKKSTIEPI